LHPDNKKRKAKRDRHENEFFTAKEREKAEGGIAVADVDDLKEKASVPGRRLTVITLLISYGRS
jgi:hypothetical protein